MGFLCFCKETPGKKAARDPFPERGLRTLPKGKGHFRFQCENASPQRHTDENTHLMRACALTVGVFLTLRGSRFSPRTLVFLNGFLTCSNLITDRGDPVGGGSLKITSVDRPIERWDAVERKVSFRPCSYLVRPDAKTKAPPESMFRGAERAARG